MRRRLVVLALAACLLGGACGRGHEELGGGPDVDVCAGYDAYERLPEPDPSSAAQVLAWTSAVLRVLERTQTDEEVRDQTDHRRPVPREVVEAVGVVRRSVEQLRDRVRAAAPGGPDAVRRASDALALDGAFAAAHRELTAFRTTTCR